MSEHANRTERVELRLSGSGGQGLITAGVILAEAAVRDGRNVVQTQSYGPEARLGASRSEVIIAGDMIAYPQVTQPDILLCLSQDAFQKYGADTGAGTTVIVDSTYVAPDPSGVGEGAKLHAYPITEVAVEVGSKVVANVVALGALNALASVVSRESLREAVVRRVPERFRKLNEEALQAGGRLGTSSEMARERGSP